MKQKRAQTSLFVLIGIVIVAGVIIFTLMQQQGQQVPEQEQGFTATDVEAFVQDCIEMTGKKGIETRNWKLEINSAEKVGYSETN